MTLCALKEKITSAQSDQAHDGRLHRRKVLSHGAQDRVWCDRLNRLEEAIRRLRELSEEQRAEIAREMIRVASKLEGRRKTEGL